MILLCILHYSQKCVCFKTKIYEYGPKTHKRLNSFFPQNVIFFRNCAGSQCHDIIGLAGTTQSFSADKVQTNETSLNVEAIVCIILFMFVPTRCDRVCHGTWVTALGVLLTKDDSLDGASRDFCISIHTQKKQMRKKTWQSTVLYMWSIFVQS